MPHRILIVDDNEIIRGSIRSCIERNTDWKVCGEAALLHFNLGVLLEDMDRRREAVLAYEAALRVSPDFADCHYNLSLLYQALQRPRDAIRHMAHYRRLSAGKK